MPKQLNVNLSFNADTDKAKAAIMDLQNSLRQLGSTVPKSTNQLFDTKVLKEASQAAKELQQHLASAVDVNTGKLNLGQFSASLKKANTSLQDYQRKLEALGPEGERAFAKLANNIALAENPTKRVNAQLQQFATTLKNTARWQISSSILHGFMGALQSAYGYAQDLNQSLNNIRIVTGASVDEMAQFAGNANKAAQALSTSTTQYTDAALIYYQQGIRDQEEIAGRVETTIKLANVSRQSAEEVSDQMTAIWNNFYDGSHSLEYYADVITALGAATASSSEEISTGLQKFAAIADTVGLSYEYATSALATITATTRQSADTVGTGLRTLFSRLEGLKLGETLEDGVDLNKYSEALASVGVQVLDTTGELRNMDEILDDLGERWGDLSKAQQTALAQTVGGVRQYTNLIALMDNWDFMQENLKVASGAEGTLQQQANIYAESWEAAQKRVRAALEGIYNELLNDKFFIALNNGFATFLTGVNSVVKGMGGLKGVLATVGALVAQHFAREMPAALDRIKEDLIIISGQAQKTGSTIQSNIAELTHAQSQAQFGEIYHGQGSMELAAELELTSKIAEQRRALSANEASYSAAEKAHGQEVLNNLIAQREELMTAGKAYDQLHTSAQNMYDILLQQASAYSDKIIDIASKSEVAGTMKGVVDALTPMTDAFKELGNEEEVFKKLGLSADEVKAKLIQMGDATRAAVGSTTFGDDLKKQLDQIKDGTAATSEDLIKFAQNLQALGQTQFNLNNESLQQLIAEINDLEAKKEIPAATAEKIRQLAQAMQQLGLDSIKIPGAIEHASHNIDQLGKHTVKTSELVTKFSGVLMQFSAVLNSVKRFKDVFSDEDATTIDKIGAAIGLLTTGFMLYKQTVDLASGITAKAAAASTADAAAKGAEAVATEGATTAQWSLNAALAACPIGWIIAGIAALTVALAGVAYGIKLVVDAYNSDKIAAKAASSALEKLSEAEQQATDNAENLKTAIEGYDSCVAKLDECTKGTQEWRDAFKETGEAALKIIDQVDDFLGVKEYQQLLKDYREGKGLNEEILKTAQERADAAKTEALYAKNIADYHATEANLNAQQTALSRSMRETQGTGLQQDANNVIDTHFIQKHFEELVGTLDAQELRDKLEALGVDVSNLDNTTLNNWRTQIDSMADTALQAAEKLSLITQMEIEQFLADKGLADKYSEGEKAYAASQQEQYSVEAQNKWVDRMRNEMQQSDDSSNALYQEILGLLQKSGKELYADANGVRGSDDQRMLAFRDAEGELKEFSAEYVASLLAAEEGLDNIITDLDTAKNTLTGVSDKGKEFANSVMEGFKDGEIDLSEYVKNYTGKEMNELKNASNEELLTVLGITEEQLSEIANLYGISVNDILNQVRNSFTSGAENFDKIGEDLVSSAFKNIFSELSKDGNLTASGKEALAQQLNSAMTQGGVEGAKFLTEMYQAVPKEELENAIQTFNNIDWSVIAPEDLAEKMSTMGLSFTTTGLQIANIIAMMQGSLEGLSVEEAAQKFDAISAVQDKITEAGATLSSEDYSQLPIIARDFFEETARGEYVLTASTEEFNKVVNEAKTNMLSSSLDAGFTQQNTLENANTTNGVYQASSPIVSGSGGAPTMLDTGALQEQINLLQIFGEECGKTQKEINALVEHDWNNLDLTKEEDIQKVNELTNAVNNLNISEDQRTEKLQQIAEQNDIQSRQIAMTCNDLNTLNELYENGRINLETYNEACETLTNIDGIDEDNVEAWKDLGDYLSEDAENLDDISDELKENKKNARSVAKEFTRFQEAVDDIAESYEEWKDQLKSGDWNKHQKAVKGLQKAYGDMFNLTEDVSEGFATTAKNMEDLEKAANGDEEAYDRLRDAVEQDILGQIAVDDEQLQSLGNDYDYIKNYIESNDIQAGASIDDTEFLNACQRMVDAATAAGLDAEAALCAAGVDVELEEVDAETVDTKEAVGWQATADTVPLTGSVPNISTSSNGGVEVNGNIPLSGSFPTVSVQPDTETEEETKHTTGTALKVTGAHYNGGGGTKINHSSASNCFVAGTLITTNQGLKKIEDICPGDIVLSYNETTHQNEYSQVLQTMIHYSLTNIYAIYIDSEILQVTGIHRFYIKRAGIAQWLPASELCVGDLMYLASGQWCAINHIIRKKKFKKVYNFEVSNNHNYYVSKSQILAHNKGGCFIAGTLITTNHGFETIEAIQPGDIVLSYNENTHQNEYSRVIDTMIHKIWTILYSLYIENEVINVTDIHRFYILRDNQLKWIPASDIQLFDLVLFADGTWHKIHNIEKKRSFKTVYNFEVENNHNYYVSKSQVLVHNKGCFVAKTLIATDNGYKNIEDIQVGDIVLSYNEEKQENTYSKVAQTMIHFVHEKIYKLYIDNETLQVTGIHRFFIKRNNQISWIHAENLQVGDLVLYSNGTWHEIKIIESKVRFRKVYNFEVSNTHNYYVGQNQILAHNKGGGRRRGGGRARRAEHMRVEKEEKKLSDDGKERYHVISTQLEKINGQLTKVSTAYDRAFGKEKLKLLDDQIAKQKDLINSQKKYVKEIEQYNKLDTKNLTKGTKTYWSETEGKFKQVSANASKSKTFKASSTIDKDGINATSGTTIKKGKGKAKGKGKKKKLTNSKKKNRTGRRRTTKRGTRARVTSRGRAGKGGGRKGSSRRRVRRTSSKSSSEKKFNSYLELDPIFDDNGVIVNYDELIEANNKAYNKAMAQIDKESEAWVKKINDARDKAAKSGKEKDEERAKQLEEDFEKWRKAAEEEAQAQYDAFIDFFNQYEETQALLEEERQNLIDQQNALYDMQLEKVTLTVQLKVDIAEDKLKLLENLLEQVGDKAYNTAKRLALIGQQLQADQSKLNAYKEGIAGIFENHGIENGDQVLGDFFNGKINAQDLLQSMSTDGSGNHFTEAEAAYFREAADAALEYNSSVMEMRSKVVEEIGNVMDDNAEKLDRITSKMDYLKNVANSYKNIIDLTGRSFLKVSTQVYDEIEKTNVQLATQSLEMVKGRKEQAMAQYQELLSKYASIQSQLSDQEKDLWKEQIKVAEDAVQEQTQNFYSSWEEAIEAVNTRFESMMNNISEDFSRTMAGQAGNLEGLQQKMSLKKDVADVYLPSYERIYQLTKLTNEAQKAIDQSNNVKVQKELEKVQQKILDAKKSGNDLSKYDIEYLTKELELKKAQMALEEAEQVKSQVRMTRDSEGNFSYVYTADEQAVEDAEADYNAKLYEMQKLNEEYIVSLQDQLVSLEQDYISAIQEAASIYGQGTVEYEEAVMQINEDYNQYFGNLKEQLDGALANQLETQQEHAKIYVELTGDVDQANANVTTAWEETMLQQQTGFETLAEYQAAWETSTAETLAAVQQANEDWKTGMETVYEEAGYSLTTHGENTQTFSEQVQGALQDIAKEGDKTKEDMDAMLQQTSQAFTDVTNGVLAWEAQYSAVIDANITKNNEFVASINDLLLAWSGFEDEITGSSAFPEFGNTVESVGDAVNAALDQIRASLDAAQQRYDEAKARRTAARTRKDRARRALGRRLRRAEARVTRARRRVRDAETRRARARSRVDRARKSVAAAKRALRDARGRRARAAARRALRRAQRTLTRAKRTLRRANTTLRRAKRNLRTQEKRLRTAVRRASRRERQKWRTYQTAIKTYRRTVTEQKEAKANLDYWKNQYNEAKTLGEQAIAEAKAQEEAQRQEAEAQGAKVITPEVNLSNADTTALTDKVSSAVDTNTQAFLDAVQKMSITPTVNVDLPKDLNQHVTFDKIEFPSVVNKDEIIAALSTLLSQDAASQFANRV